MAKKDLLDQPIDIGINVDLIPLLESKLLIQANSGGGKSYLLRKVIESVGKSVQQIIVDPEGEFVTLREKFDFVLVSNKDGDIPLNVKYAEMLAYKILETGISVIIDLYGIKRHDRILFVKFFLDALIDAPKELWHYCFVYIDEAHIFCPEKGKAESLSSVIELCSSGRKRGFGAVLATQRLSKLDKDAAAECNNKLIGRTTLDIDRKRAGDEMGFINKQDFLSFGLLKPGEFYASGPAICNEVTKFKVKKVITTHLQAGKRMIAPPPTPGAVVKILAKLQGIPQEAEKELQTKKDYQQEIARLKGENSKLSRQLKSGQAPTQAIDNSKLQALQQSTVELKDQLKNRDWEIKILLKAITRSHEILKDVLNEIENTQTKNSNSELGKHPVPLLDNKTILPSVSPSARSVYKAEKRVPGNNDTLNISVGERLVLNACAQYETGGLKRDQITVITGYKRSTRDAYIQRLIQKELLELVANKLVATGIGIETLGDSFKPLPTGKELQQYWLQNLPQGEKKILEVLLSAYPNAVTREDITDQTGYLRSTRDAYIQRMTARQVITVMGRGEVRASEYLFI